MHANEGKWCTNYPKINGYLRYFKLKNLSFVALCSRDCNLILEMFFLLQLFYFFT